MKPLNIYTDGSCLHSVANRPGGWCAVFADGQRYQGAQFGTDPEQMELLAVIRGLEYAPQQTTIRLYTDSECTFRLAHGLPQKVRPEHGPLVLRLRMMLAHRWATIIWHKTAK